MPGNSLPFSCNKAVSVFRLFDSQGFIRQPPLFLSRILLQGCRQFAFTFHGASVPLLSSSPFPRNACTTFFLLPRSFLFPFSAELPARQSQFRRRFYSPLLFPPLLDDIEPISVIFLSPRSILSHKPLSYNNFFSLLRIV